ncbi:hypothetical protein [Bradyrhizobium vignae]|uniref:hypothetical protein n=1 Tax=Bradyrhizobium vignae TaxID=1549949 RepID=UPI00100A8DDD|nr:hypothetical protein [Bradyrhizobium vignae]RXG91885.1 hypothetical protein EAV90_27645 [Bradyrhizobium vignae]
MPLIQIRYNASAIPVEAISALRETLPAVAAKALTCADNIKCVPKDIMLEFERMSAFDLNCKDINIRVWAHDYPSRREILDLAREHIAKEVLKHVPTEVSWYVWMLPMPSSYGSDAEQLFFSSSQLKYGTQSSL